MSGGLDSTLAAKLIQEQGIEIIGLNFKTPFCLCDRKGPSACLSHAHQAAINLGIEFKVVNIADEFFRVIAGPRHGFGANMNPCIDCRILKFRKAKEYMPDLGAAFIVTGEVLAQRPMSQHRRSLKIIDQESQLEGLVLRPLSARLLPQTIPEREGWVSRDKLLDFSGRSRKPQMALAEKMQIKDYPCPAGGCLLTDPEFSRRIKDLLKHEVLHLNNVELLKVGRHFRFSPQAKLIVGRNRQENERLIHLVRERDYLFYPDANLAGPTALGRGIFNEDLIRLSCSIVARYCDLNGSQEARLIYKMIPQQEERCVARPLAETALLGLRI